MVVNASKTAMLCVSESLAYTADAYILDADGNHIGCTKGIKALGFCFSSRPDMSAQVEHIKKSMRSRFWTLRNLKNSGFNEDELVRVYVTMIRPVAEYDCVVYHSSLTDQQDEVLDRLQNQVLKCVYGPGISGRKMCAMAGLDTLRKRCEDICDKFAAKCSKDPRFEHWFPQRKGRMSSRLAGKKKEEFLELRARCDRLANSPLFYFRRRLNGKEGKKYGKRNAEYRED